MIESHSTCQFPSHKPSTGYKYGCRCDRCCSHNRDYLSRWHEKHPGRASSYSARSQAKRPRKQRQPRPPQPAIDRFLPRVRIIEADDACWLWYGYTNRYGYGRFYWNGRSGFAHRFAYEHWVGPVPEGLELDHLCTVPACCNPSHLEPVTTQENTTRGFQTRRPWGL